MLQLVETVCFAIILAEHICALVSYSRSIRATAKSSSKHKETENSLLQNSIQLYVYIRHLRPGSSCQQGFTSGICTDSGSFRTLDEDAVVFDRKKPQAIPKHTRQPTENELSSTSYVTCL